MDHWVREKETGDKLRVTEALPFRKSCQPSQVFRCLSPCSTCLRVPPGPENGSLSPALHPRPRPRLAPGAPQAGSEQPRDTASPHPSLQTLSHVTGKTRPCAWRPGARRVSLQAGRGRGGMERPRVRMGMGTLEGAPAPASGRPQGTAVGEGPRLSPVKMCPVLRTVRSVWGQALQGVSLGGLGPHAPICGHLTPGWMQSLVHVMPRPEEPCASG